MTGIFGDRLTAASIRGLACLPWWCSQGIAWFIGKTVAAIPSARVHKIARINLALCLPEFSELERNRMARESMVMVTKCAVAGAVSWAAPLKLMREKISRVEGEDIFLAVVQSRAPVIFITPHLGCWELLNYYLCDRVDLTILAKPFGGKYLNRLIESGRSRLRGRVVPTNEKGVRELLRDLRAGRMTILLADHIPKEGGGIVAPFFGVPALTPTLPSRLVQATGAKVIAVFCTLDPDGRFSIRFQEGDCLVSSPDLDVSVAAINRTLEACIRSSPEQYQWNYRRFRDLPGIGNPYR